MYVVHVNFVFDRTNRKYFGRCKSLHDYGRRRRRRPRRRRPRRLSD